MTFTCTTLMPRMKYLDLTERPLYRDFNISICNVKLFFPPPWSLSHIPLTSAYAQTCIALSSSHSHPPTTATQSPLSYRAEIQEVAEFLVSFHCSHSLLLFVHTLQFLINPTREICRYRILMALANTKRSYMFLLNRDDGKG